MRWNKGYTSRYTATIVDPITWRDIEQFEITGGTIDRTEKDLLESADIDTTVPLEEKWIRIYLDARQEGESSERIPLFTGLAICPETQHDGTRITYALECYSVLKPADDVLLQRGYYAPRGSSAELVKNLLSVCNVRVEIDTESSRLQEHIVAEDGETRLSMAHKIINALNMLIRIDGMGVVHLINKPTTEMAVFSVDYDVVELKVKSKSDAYDLPNVFRATSGDTVATARDDDNVRVRGREVWNEELDVDLSDNETLADYATRRLKELQNVSSTIDYTRRYIPNLFIGDIVRFNYPNLQGTYKITSQKITLGYNCTTSEGAEWA